MNLQTITSDYWQARLPEDWVHKPGQVEQLLYFQSPDNAAGAYFSTWRTNGEPLRSVIEKARASERLNLPGGGDWKVLNESESDTESQLDVVSEYFNRDAKYRLVSRYLGRADYFVRLTLHDYDCAEPAESAQRFSAWVQSLTLLEPGDAP